MLRNERQAYFTLASNTRSGAVNPLAVAKRLAAKMECFKASDLSYADRLDLMVTGDNRAGKVW